MLEKKSQTFHYYLRIAFISMLPFPPRSPPFSSLYIFFAFDWRFIWYPSSFVPNMIYHILRISVQSLINICFFRLINTWKWNLKKSRSGFDYCQVSTTVRFGRIFIPDLFRFSLLLLLLSLYFFWYNFYFKEWVTNPSCSGIMYSFLGFFLCQLNLILKEFIDWWINSILWTIERRGRKWVVADVWGKLGTRCQLAVFLF